jgi:hypothetical protein
MVTRRGKKKALMAIGHKIIIAAYFVIKNKESYKEPLLNDDPMRKNKQIKNYLAKLKELGIELEVKNVALNPKGRMFTGEPLMASRT